jgi:hypothetical protein
LCERRTDSQAEPSQLIGHSPALQRPMQEQSTRFHKTCLHAELVRVLTVGIRNRRAMAGEGRRQGAEGTKDTARGRGATGTYRVSHPGTSGIPGSSVRGVDVQLDLVPVRIQRVHALGESPVRLVEDGGP